MFMTDNQRDVLLALNLRQMQRADWPTEHGVDTESVAKAAGRSTRSAATILSQMRDFGWVQSTHDWDGIGWVLVAKGVAALERDAGRTPAMASDDKHPPA